MKILAFDTATRSTAVALELGEGRVLAARDDPAPGRRPNHTTRLMPLISELMSDTGTEWHELDRIAVGVGPGTFTGLRIGIATARALSQATGLALVGVSTLEALALNAETQSDAAAAIAVLDARRGEVFAAGWALDGPRRLLIAPAALAPERLVERIAQLGISAVAIGDGAVEFRPILERSSALIPDDPSELHRVTAISHCRLARSLVPGDRDEVSPEYLRLPDAELARRAKRPQ